MKTVFIKVIFYVKNKERKYTQISSVGAAVPRQVMKRKARNPCKTDSQTNQSAVGATDVGCFVCPLSVFFRSISNHFWQHYPKFKVQSSEFKVQSSKLKVLKNHFTNFSVYKMLSCCLNKSLLSLFG